MKTITILGTFCHTAFMSMYLLTWLGIYSSNGIYSINFHVCFPKIDLKLDLHCVLLPSTPLLFPINSFLVPCPSPQPSIIPCSLFIASHPSFHPSLLLLPSPSCLLASAQVGSLHSRVMTACITVSTRVGGRPYDLISVMSFLFRDSKAWPRKISITKRNVH